MKADLILTNGRIYTLNLARPRASALAVFGSHLVAVGENDEILPLAGPNTQCIDAAGKCVLPGLCDAHFHLHWFALNLTQVDLRDTLSLSEAVERVRRHLSGVQPGQWLLGNGWLQSLWVENRFPTRADLDALAQQVPMYLTARSGHAAWVNTSALKRANITSATPDPPGGEILRDAAGEPTGLLLELPAMALVEQVIPPPSEEFVDKALERAIAICHQGGLTAIHDMDGKPALLALQRLKQADKLKLRVVSNVRVEQFRAMLEAGVRSGLGDEWLRLGWLKIFADGALGPRTASLLRPYEGEPHNYGIIITDKEELHHLVTSATLAGIPAAVHAIGDRANHDVLDVFEAARILEASNSISPAQRRHRIEHVQLLHRDDIPRLAELGVIASMQPIHATTDMHMVDRHWGSRGEYAFAWRSLARLGTRMIFGSDAPVEDYRPFAGMHAAVTRRRADGSPASDGWYGSQRLTPAEAVAGYTTGPAAAAGQEHRVGTLTPGKLADFIVVSDDVFTCEPMAIKDIQVELTVIDGKVRHRTLA